MVESVQDLRVSTLHSCGEVEQAMREITNTARQSSEQHVELGSSRYQRDFEDLKKILGWLEKFDPFDVSDQHLRSLSSGLAVQLEDKINCDDAESVGRTIQNELDNVSVEAKVARKKKV